MAVRFLTAVVFVPCLLALLFVGPTWGFYALVAFASAVGASELFAMTHPGDRIAQGIGVVLTLAVSAAVYFATTDSRILLAVFLIVPVVGVLLPLWRLGEIESAGLRIMANVAAPLYIGGLFATIGLLRRDLGAEGPRWVILTLTFAWLADTGGYFAGRFLGKTKLYERVSPKKTREGFYGALGGAALGAVIASLWYLPSIPLQHSIPLAIVAGGLGQMGDLVESLLKRSTGIKDSGWIVPGHGGLLDRVDALLIVSPIVYLYSVFRG
ncbi:MAG: phosphatidate cytidylyltransferase [Myxococcales bacterium]|nr:phosphatidate cytidylyltransferase [Myxococcales bacterium]